MGLIDRDAVLEAIDAKCRKYFASVGITDFDYEKADEKLRWISDGAAMAVDAVLDAPTIDPVKHGKWETEVRTILGYKIPLFACSVCGYKNANDEYNYCPNCGARMGVPDNDVGETEGEEDEERLDATEQG